MLRYYETRWQLANCPDDILDPLLQKILGVDYQYVGYPFIRKNKDILDLSKDCGYDRFNDMFGEEMEQDQNKHSMEIKEDELDEIGNYCGKFL